MVRSAPDGEAPEPAPPEKKRRGRPRKSERPDTEVGTEAEQQRKERRKSGDDPTKSGEHLRSKKKRQRRDTIGSDEQGTGSLTMFEKLEEEDARGAGGATEVRVGQSVHGVVDGTFDAGYLVTIRVGDAETVFRGIMFGHGLYSPLSTDNDVAPDLKKVSRADEAGIPASEQEAGGAGASDITETPQSASLALPSPPPDPCKGLAQVNASTSASPVPTIPHALAGVQPFSQDRLFFASAPLTSPMYDHVHTTYRSPLFPQRQPPQSVAENPYHAVPDYPVYRPAMPTNLTPNFGCPPNSQSLPTDYAAAPVLNRETRKDDDSSIVASDWRLD